jgi:hypothetical protein
MALATTLLKRPVFLAAQTCGSSGECLRGAVPGRIGEIIFFLTAFQTDSDPILRARLCSVAIMLLWLYILLVFGIWYND